MINILKSNETGLGILEHVNDGCWINAVNPSPDEINQLTELGLPDDFITYPLDLDERARIEWEDNGDTLIVIRIPYFQGTEADVPYITIPLGIVLTQRFILTVCSQQSDIILGLTSRRDLSTTKRNRFLLHTLLRTAQKYLTHLREINKIVGTLAKKGVTLIPLKVFFNERGYLKIELAFAKHKKLYDKKQQIKDREVKLEADRAKKLRY